MKYNLAIIAFYIVYILAVGAFVYMVDTVA